MLPTVLAIIALIVVLRLPSFFEPHHYGDEGVFAATAQQLLAGKVLYRDVWDDKPPAVFLVYAAVLRLFGPSMGALRVLGAVWAAATALIVLAIGRRVAGSRAGWSAAVVYAVLAALPMTESTLLLTEALAALPAAAAVLVVLRGCSDGRGEGPGAPAHRPAAVSGRTRALVAGGMLLGLAFLCKQVAALDAAAVGSWLALRRGRPLADAAWLTVGWCVPVVGAATGLAALGAGVDAWHALFGFYGFYLQEGSALPPLLKVARFVPAVVAIAWAVWARWRTGTVLPSHLLVLWFGFALLGATLAGRPFGHYLAQTYAPAALVAGLALSRRRVATDRASAMGAAPAQVGEGEGLAPRGGDRLGAALLLAFGLILVLAGFRGFWLSHPTLTPAAYANWLAWLSGTRSRDAHDRFYSWRVDNQRVLARLIAADGGERSLFVWGEYPWLYPLATARNPTRFATSYHTSFLAGAKQEVLDALRRDPPQYIVQELEEWRRLPGLERLLEERYQPMARVDNTVLWRRRDPPRSGRRTAECPMIRWGPQHADERISCR